VIKKLIKFISIVKMSKLLEFFLGSLLISVFTIAFTFFSALHYVLRVVGITDCAWQGSAVAWVDSNGDGLLNHGEPPLPNVEIHIEDVKNRLADEGSLSWPAVTNKDGDVRLNVSIPSCSDTVFEVYVKIPQGYRMTTTPRVEVHSDFWASLGAENIYYFGFVSER
jgi:hypothetical protein